MRVLYCHGLESGPSGRKPRILAACGYRVTSVAMPCTKSSLLWDPLFLLAGAALLGLLVAAPILLLLAPLLWLGRRRAAALLRPLVVRRVFARCVAAQEAAARACRPELLVGSSFGGAVALELMRRGTVACPALLLCPAHRLVAELAGQPPPAAPRGYPGRVLLVHGTADSVVPPEHSAQLAREGGWALEEAPEDGHPLHRAWRVDAIKRWVAQLTE